MTNSVPTSQNKSLTDAARMSDIRALIVDRQRTARKIVRGLLGQAGATKVLAKAIFWPDPAGEIRQASGFSA